MLDFIDVYKYCLYISIGKIMCEHCEQREIKEYKSDMAFDCGARLRQSFTREIEFCKEYYLPCDDILDCKNKFGEIL